MWQPNRGQWRVIWSAAIVVLLLWPAGADRSLAVKAVNWAADPRGALPRLPGPIPMGLGDDADAVMAHDEEEAEYYRLYESSRFARMRLKMRDLQDPIDPATERQILIAVGVLAALLAWRTAG